ncbi:putative P-loop containing nucleoside triphosphate hydrolase protein [Lyophyllum shimeji]|uniref:RNA helicase n=1 Tax=Lyophyllum shimeji TaxID=47721 RepID=A0A9P3UTZ7_LYOSH|nr:putative P-loop containing nucleoside triphosphate hydrolase protein [Lyophyllum shimeji]
MPKISVFAFASRLLSAESGFMLRSTTSQLCKAERSLQFYTTAVLPVQLLNRRHKDASRRRLTEAMKMKPGSRSANLEVAPRSRGAKNKSSRDTHDPELTSKRNFARDAVPHSDSQYVNTLRQKDSKPSSFRRKGRQNNPVEERSGRWTRERELGAGAQFGDGGSGPSRQLESRSTTKPHMVDSAVPEFSESSITTPRQDSSDLPKEFTSPPLMPGLLSCLTDLIGPGATPTPIQSLSLKWLMHDAEKGHDASSSDWKQFLLASETGSGKSIAYLLPLLQDLKQSELASASSPRPRPIPGPESGPTRALNPRALILAPTHELSRQLSGFAKSLLHEVKLRVLCASRANTKSTKERDATARQMVAQFESGLDDKAGEFEVRDRSGFPVDVVVGTPMKLLEMVKGRGWDRKQVDAKDELAAGESDSERPGRLRRGRDKMVGVGKWRSQPEMGLANVAWVVVDEADVLFDPDFQETTRQLLADISSARGYAVPSPTSTPLSPTASPPTTPAPAPTPIEYPFNFILTSATIPSALASYLDTYHPKLMRLASPHLHHLPKTLQTEYVSWTGGNKLADIERRIRRVWAEDASLSVIPGKGDGKGGLSRVLIFCNRSSKVEELGKYLEERGIKNVALSSTSEHRKRGSNHHLDGFLRGHAKDAEGAAGVDTASAALGVGVTSDPKSSPHVMITTSLLSRGLDFSPSIRHVFIVDEPRNMIDFLHRAGRTGRAGQKGKVVVFGKMKGRGSAKAKDVRKKVGSLVAH